MIPSSTTASFACFSALAVIAALICYMMTEIRLYPSSVCGD